MNIPHTNSVVHFDALSSSGYGDVNRIGIIGSERHVACVCMDYVLKLLVMALPKMMRLIRSQDNSHYVNRNADHEHTCSENPIAHQVEISSVLFRQIVEYQYGRCDVALDYFAIIIGLHSDVDDSGLSSLLAIFGHRRFSISEYAFESFYAVCTEDYERGIYKLKTIELQEHFTCGVDAVSIDFNSHKIESLSAKAKIRGRFYQCSIVNENSRYMQGRVNCNFLLTGVDELCGSAW